MTTILSRRGYLALAAVVAITILCLLPFQVPTSAIPFSITKQGSRADKLDDTLNSTLGFEKIYVVNLPSRTDLRDAVALAARLTQLDVTIVDGVDGTTISNKSLPYGAEKVNLKPGGLGNWRAHMNVARLMVEQNVQSALVLENDADWDIRIKQQMRQFAQASRLLLQPIRGTNDTFLDPTNPRSRGSTETMTFDIADETLESRIATPISSPYGDLNMWDMLWLGHCGSRFSLPSDGNPPLARAAIYDDITVPEHMHIDVAFGDRSLVSHYPDHTRVVSRARVNTCTLGHAFSQRGAQKFLYNLSIKEMTGTTDMMFRSMCDGDGAESPATCLTVQPQLFNHHRPRGSKSKESDIDNHGDEYNPHPYTTNIRWSTRLNFARLIAGRTDYIDLYQDGVPESIWPDDV